MRLRARSPMLACLCAVACAPVDPTLLVHTSVDETLGTTQLAFTVAFDTDTLGPEVRPATEGPVLTPGQSARLFLPRSSVGTHGRVDVEARAGGVAVGRGSLEFDVKSGELDLVVRVEGLTCSPACPSGQACVSGECRCTPTSCPDGCCANNECRINLLNLCGVRGAACGACSVALADTCTAGACNCGIGAACPAGKQCVAGQCHCTPASCPSGCCLADQCQPGTTAAACGGSGQTCQTCPGAQPCVRGACAGCSTSCTTGCCAGASCQALSLSSCGPLGGACTSCDAAKADRCSSGACQCGTTAPCGGGQRCVNMRCVCDSTSCPSGCCMGSTCVTPSTSTCGTAGGSCTACTAASDACIGGQCRCGGSNPCGAGTTCVNGACVCNATSCSGGCCTNGTTCHSGTSDSNCGGGGGTCRSCMGNRHCQSNRQCQ